MLGRPATVACCEQPGEPLDLPTGSGGATPGQWRAPRIWGLTTMSEMDNTESWREVLDDLELLRAASRAMGGEERLRKHRNAGKLDARTRIGHLLDPGTFMEIGTLVGGTDAP